MSPKDSGETQTGDSSWLHAAPGGDSECLHLTILWSREEPERIGEVCAAARPALIGRGPSTDPGDPPKLEFVRQRPGANEPTGLLGDAKLSRRQWHVQPAGASLAVRNLGRRGLFHNGVDCDECKADVGDTLGVDGVFLCLVERRPRLLPPSRFEAFPFARADADGIAGESPAVWQCRKDLALLGALDAHVLVLGESGSGKESAARALHRHSNRARAAFVSRNAATIPASLVEVELFGNAAGYPNAGTPAHAGLVSTAHGGTLFLDEIAELGLPQQANLLRVLDSGEYQRLGEATPRISDFRLIAATNRAPEELKHDFLARFPERLEVPDLNERRADVPCLVRLLLEQMGSSAVLVRPALIDHLVRHRYTHHFRELERLVRLALRTSPAGTLDLTDALRDELDVRSSAAPVTEAGIREVLASAASLADAAKRLGLPSRYALYRLLKKHGISA